jgi:hypothetical protein
MTPIVTIHNQLMGPRYQFEIISVIEILRYVLSKCESSTSWRDTPTMSIIWVGPKEITHWSLMWYLNLSINLSNLFECIQVWGKSSM